MIPTIKIKCTTAAFQDASDIALDLIRPSCKLLGPNPGDEYIEKMGGRKFIAKRKRDGGVDIREVMPRTTVGWERKAYEEMCDTEAFL